MITKKKALKYTDKLISYTDDLCEQRRKNKTCPDGCDGCDGCPLDVRLRALQDILKETRND